MAFNARDTFTIDLPGPNGLPFNIVTKKLMGQDVRWAQTHGLPDISIPNSMAEADIPKYVAEKQRLQAAGMAETLFAGVGTTLEVRCAQA